MPKVTRHTRVDDVTNPGIRWPAGVGAWPLTPHRDGRGYFMEVVRVADLGKRGFSPAQVSVSETVPGVTKAFHFHLRQTDLFCPLAGRFRIVLLDGREGSATRGEALSVYSEGGRPFILRIPPGVAHGYRVLGDTPASMLYIMDREYDPSDEHRVEWDDPAVGFPWDEGSL